MTRKALAAIAMGAALAGAVTAQAQSIPNTFTFTARVSNADGPLDGTHQIILRMYDAATAGNKLWEESHVDVQVDAGLVTMVMGSETNITNGDLTDSGVWVEVVVDGSTLAPRIQLRSVPYARRSSDSLTLRGNAPSAFATAAHNHDSAYVNTGGDTMSGSLGINGDLNLNGALAVRGNDSYLRLNQAQSFSNGVYTPGTFRVDGGINSLNAGGVFTHIPYTGNGWNYLTGGGTIFRADSSGAEYARIDGNGVISLGTNVGDCPGGWFCNVYSWDISAASVYAYFLDRSDRRLKKNIEPTPFGLDEILKLRPVSFEWKDPRQRGIHYGFISQEIEEVMPQMVTTTQKGYKAFESLGVLSVTVKAVQELKAENDKLKGDVDRLAGLVEQQQREIEAIKAGHPLPARAASAGGGKTAARWIVPVGLGGGLSLVFAFGAIATVGRRRRGKLPPDSH